MSRRLRDGFGDVLDFVFFFFFSSGSLAAFLDFAFFFFFLCFEDREVDDFEESEPDPEQDVRESNCGQRCLAWLSVVYELGPEDALTV